MSVAGLHAPISTLLVRFTYIDLGLRIEGESPDGAPHMILVSSYKCAMYADCNIDVICESLDSFSSNPSSPPRLKSSLFTAHISCTPRFTSAQRRTHASCLCARCVASCIGPQASALVSRHYNHHPSQPELRDKQDDLRFDDDVESGM